MLKDLDDGIGLLSQKLRELGIDDNTYVIFMGDNGGRERMASSDTPHDCNFMTDNAPLKKGKFFIDEGGIRVPAFLRWPGGMFL